MTDEGSDHGAGVEELATVLGPALDSVSLSDVSAELIFSEPAASATVGIWRFSEGDRSVILKVVRHGASGSPMWQSGDDEGHWYYWRREALAYSSGFLDVFSDGLRAPRCLGVFDRPDGSVGIWLEDLRTAESAAAWAIERYRSAALGLGWAQGQSAGSAPGATQAWLSRQWLRRYVERRGSFLKALEQAAWDHPIVRENLPSGTAQEATAIWKEREALLATVEAAPLCFCHIDLHPGNLFADGPTTVLIDWGFLGVGHAGEDPGNLVFDAVLDFFVAPSGFAALQEAVTEGYLEGLSATVAESDLDVVRRAIWATGAVKYFWIPLAMVDAVEEGRPTLNRRPIEEGFAAWSPLVPEIFELAHRSRSGR